MAFQVIQRNLSVIMTQIRTLASLASEVDRLHFLLVCMENIDSTVEKRETEMNSSSATSLSALNDGYVAVPPSDQSAGVVTVETDDDGDDAVKVDGDVRGISTGSNTNCDGADGSVAVGDTGAGSGGGGGGSSGNGDGDGGRVTTVVMERGFGAGQAEEHVMLKMCDVVVSLLLIFCFADVACCSWGINEASHFQLENGENNNYSHVFGAVRAPP